MTPPSIPASQAREAALQHLRSHYPSHLGMDVLDIQPLAADAGWVVWTQGIEYIRSHDPMAFVPAQPLLVTAGPTVTPLPTGTPVPESLGDLAMHLADQAT